MSPTDPIDLDEDDDDAIDGCAVDFTEDPDDDETAELRALFPDADPSPAGEWNELFG